MSIRQSRALLDRHGDSSPSVDAAWLWQRACRLPSLLCGLYSSVHRQFTIFRNTPTAGRGLDKRARGKDEL